MKAKDISGRTLVLKLKTDGFRIRTRNARLPAPTNLADKIFSGARDLLRRETDGTRYRLIGVGLSDLHEGPIEAEADFLDMDGARRAKAEAAIDAVRARFGRDGLGLGITFSPTPRRLR
jgi:DNA polymerase-4